MTFLNRELQRSFRSKKGLQKVNYTDFLDSPQKTPLHLRINNNLFRSRLRMDHNRSYRCYSHSPQ